MDLDEVKDDVLAKLQRLDVAQLGECAVQLNITIPVNRMGKKTQIRYFLMNHLTSPAIEEHNDVEEILRTLNTAMTKMLGEDGSDSSKKNVETEIETQEVKQVVKEEPNGLFSGMASSISPEAKPVVDGTVNAASCANGGSRIEIARFREFKLSNGTFGGENHVDYPSLCFQIQEGRSLNFTSREIVSGMIKAMKNPLRKYCEGKQLKGGWTLEKLMKMVSEF